MARSRIDSLRRRLGRGRTRTSPSTVALVALGAVAGVALGMVIADRTGGVDGLLRRLGAGNSGTRGTPRRASPGLESWHGDERRVHDADDMLAIDDEHTELSPESIAHMHVRERRVSSASVAARDRSVRTLPVRQVPDEATLEARVLEAFINDPILRERAIDICASGSGTIELTGWVQASGEIGHALTLARGVPDVTAVVDRLAVRGGAPARDHSGFRYAGLPPRGDSDGLRAD